MNTEETPALLFHHPSSVFSSALSSANVRAASLWSCFQSRQSVFCPVSCLSSGKGLRHSKVHSKTSLVKWDTTDESLDCRELLPYLTNLPLLPWYGQQFHSLCFTAFEKELTGSLFFFFLFLRRTFLSMLTVIQPNVHYQVIMVTLQDTVFC